MCYYEITLEDFGDDTVPMVLTGGGGNEVAIVERELVI
jgi:hypothetical protein